MFMDQINQYSEKEYTIQSNLLIQCNPYQAAAFAAAAKSLQSCPTLCDLIDAAHQAPRSLGFSGMSTGVGCHFLLQCMKVKSEK